MPPKRNGRPPAPARNTSDYSVIGNSNAKTNNAPCLSLQARRAVELRRLRRQRYAARIHPLGARVLYELVNHLAVRFEIDDAALDHVLDRLADLDPIILRGLNVDRLPTAPIHQVRR
jgi:hypothetical protein